jgi:hypothetical protein
MLLYSVLRAVSWILSYSMIFYQMQMLLQFDRNGEYRRKLVGKETDSKGF